MNINEIMAVANFLGEGMTDDQAEKLMDAARELSVRDREHLYGACHHGTIVCSKFYTELAINRVEARWEDR